MTTWELTLSPLILVQTKFLFHFAPIPVFRFVIGANISFHAASYEGVMMYIFWKFLQSERVSIENKMFIQIFLGFHLVYNLFVLHGFYFDTESWAILSAIFGKLKFESW